MYITIQHDLYYMYMIMCVELTFTTVSLSGKSSLIKAADTVSLLLRISTQPVVHLIREPNNWSSIFQVQKKRLWMS